MAEKSLLRELEILQEKRELLVRLVDSLPSNEAGRDIKRVLKRITEEVTADQKTVFTDMVGASGGNFEVVSRKRRIRTNPTGRVLNASQAKQQVIHRFRDDTILTGYLNKNAVKKFHGKVWSDNQKGASKRLVDALYQTDTGVGFATELEKRGVTLNPIAILNTKANTHFVSVEEWEQNSSSRKRDKVSA